jgi:hypothetical protein
VPKKPHNKPVPPHHHPPARQDPDHTPPRHPEPTAPAPRAMLAPLRGKHAKPPATTPVRKTRGGPTTRWSGRATDRKPHLPRPTTKPVPPRSLTQPPGHEQNPVPELHVTHQKNPWCLRALVVPSKLPPLTSLAAESPAPSPPGPAGTIRRLPPPPPVRPSRTTDHGSDHQTRHCLSSCSRQDIAPKASPRG